MLVRNIYPLWLSEFQPNGVFLEKRLKEILSQLGRRSGGTDANVHEATEALKEAKRKLEKKDAAYQNIRKCE